MKQQFRSVKNAILSIVTTFLMMASPVAAIVFASDIISASDVSTVNESASTTSADVFAIASQSADREPVISDRRGQPITPDKVAIQEESRP